MLSHLIHRNLRPPVLTITKCNGLPHFGQIGRGEFLGMETHAELRRESFAHSHRIARVADDGTMLVNYRDGCIKKEQHYVFFRNRLFGVIRIVLKDSRLHVPKVRRHFK
jgi:hypothetical protein